MPIDVLMAEAKDLPDNAIMDVVRFVRFIKVEYNRREMPDSLMEKPVIREPGQYKGQIIMADDFDEPLEEFKEYM